MKNLFIFLLVGVVTLGCSLGEDDTARFGDSNGGDTGIGGSTARFTINGDFLYIVNSTELQVIDIEKVHDPVFVSSTDLGWGIETIYGYKDYLFIGGQAGMQIFEIDNKGLPVYMSSYQHQTACDPVIANDQYAYVTIRSGVGCFNELFEVNQLITLDVSDVQRPFEVSRQQMINPRGLTFFKGDLYVAEGEHGLKKFSLAEPGSPELIEFYEDIPANDMISLGNTMIITRDEGIFQFGCIDDELLLFSPL